MIASFCQGRADEGGPCLAMTVAGTQNHSWQLLRVLPVAAEETDLSMVHWAQYMDIFNTSDQIGLVDYGGNPRPSWWAFRWFSELPVERVVRYRRKTRLTHEWRVLPAQCS